MRLTLKDQKLQNEFDATGYVVVDLFKPSEITELKALLADLESERAGTGLNMETSYKLSFFSDSPAYRKKVFDRVGSFCQPFVDRFLDNYEPLMVNTFDKEPGTGEVPVHQNWTFVDEEAYRSVSVWIPLVDVTRENGTMEVVPGSHLGVSAFRGPLIPWVFVDMIDTLKEKYMVPLNLKAGQAAIIDDAILHYTSQNETEKVRGTVQIIAKPKEATAIHYHRPSEDAQHLEVFEADSSFFQRFQMYTRPEGIPKLAEIPFEHRPLDEKRLRSITTI